VSKEKYGIGALSKVPDFAFDNPDDKVSTNLQRLFLQAHKMNPLFPDPAFSWKVVTDTNFPLEWGLGSSSTLISNLAWWAGVDPFELLFSTSSGSGYDIACARQKTPLLYRFNGAGHAPSVREVAFDPPFRRTSGLSIPAKNKAVQKVLKASIQHISIIIPSNVFLSFP
jgi:hypothetical protein